MHNVPRKAGFYIGEPRWAHTGETAFRKEFEERIKRAPKPERYKCSVEHGAPVSFEFRGTFYVFAAQSETTEQQLCDFGVLVEAVTAWFHESVEFKGRIEDQSPRLPEWPIHVHLGMLLKDLKTDEDRQLMIWFFRGADLALPLNYMINSYLHGKFVSLETPLAWLHLHVLVYLSRTLCGHGIQSLRDVTSGLDPNSPATKEHISYPFWHRMMREQIWLGDDPPIKASIGGAVSTMLWRSRLKGWALIDFLMTDHRKKFNEFLKAVDHKTRDPKDPTGEKTFFKVFEWSPEELEERLRRFVLENY